MGKKKDEHSMAKRLQENVTMANLPVLPPYPVGSFQTFASTIESTNIFPVRSIESGSPRATDQSQHAIDALNQAITKAERIEALKLALCTFSHSNVPLHDHEVNLGADKALCLKMGYVVVTSSSPLEELNLIGKCLLQIYQCSPELRKRSFRCIGATELVPLLVQVLMTGLSSTDLEASVEEQDAIMTVIQVLRVYSKLESAKSLLIRLNKGHWLGDVLQYSIASLGSAGCAEISSLDLNLLGLVKDLTFRCSPADKAIVLSVRDGIFGGLLATICGARDNIDWHILEWFTAVVWNLVLDKCICDQIMESEQVHGFPILGFVLRVMGNGCGGDCGSNSIHSKIRRNATSAIGNILAHTDNQKILFSEATRGKIHILSTLLKLVECDSDSIVRRRAMRTIRCVASSDDSSVEALMEQEQLAEFLAETISRNVSVDDENDRDTQIQACQTINALVDHLSACDWPRLETALLQRVETTNDEKLIQAACGCLAECIKKSPWRRGSSCFSEMFWTRLEAAASSCIETHPSIASLVLALAQVEKEGLIESSPDQPSILTSTTVVNTVTAVISVTDKDKEGSRKLALDTLVLLVEKMANKRPLAENECLLSALVNLCLLQPSQECKIMAKQVIMDLVPEL